jgi:hypothetical protein
MATIDISNTPLIQIFREQEAQDAILRQGAKKFGSPPAPDVQAAVRAIRDLKRLHDLQDRLLDVNTWPDLLAEPAA